MSSKQVFGKNSEWFIKSYIATLLVFTSIDYLWLAIVARDFYNKELGSMLGDVNWIAAGLFYLLYPLGIVFLVITPTLKEYSLRTGYFRALIFGLVSYATYDLTNLATISGWSMLVSIVDILWGIVINLVVFHLVIRLVKDSQI